MIFLMLIVGGLFGVVFLSILERKILGIIQIRKGPNKTGVMGLFQSVSDALKLITKEMLKQMKLMFNLWVVFPMLMSMLVFLLWVLYVVNHENYSMDFGVLFFFLVLSFEGYILLWMSWMSNNKYALMSSFRGVSQTISYEIIFFLIMLSILFLMNSFNLNLYMLIQNWGVVLVVLVWVYFNMVYMLLVVESNRSPSDLMEGESELVSGFNIEFMSMNLSFIFIAEYLKMMVMMMVMVVLVLGKWIYLWGSLFCFNLIWFRGSFPRFRYNNLMMMIWKNFLPVVMGLFYVFYYLFL